VPAASETAAVRSPLFVSRHREWAYPAAAGALLLRRQAASSGHQPCARSALQQLALDLSHGARGLRLFHPVRSDRLEQAMHHNFKGAALFGEAGDSRDCGAQTSPCIWPVERSK
jgi:hypothetical protein